MLVAWRVLILPYNIQTPKHHLEPLSSWQSASLRFVAALSLPGSEFHVSYGISMQKSMFLSARSSEIKSRLTKFNLNAIWLVEPLRGRPNCQLMDHYRFLLSVKDITACCNIQDSSHAIMLPASQVPQNEYVLIETNAILNAIWQCVDLLILSQHLERQDHPWCLRHCNGGRLNPGCAPCKNPGREKESHHSNNFINLDRFSPII